MRKLFAAFAVIFTISALAVGAQPVLSANWEIFGGGIAGFPSSGSVVRDLAYNPFTDHVLVPTRAGGASIEILDAATGASQGFMDTTAMAASSAMFFPIHQVEVADDGAVFATGLTLSAGGQQIFRWPNEASSVVSQAASTGDNTNRMGDSFAVVGSGATTVLYGSGTFNTNIEVWTTGDGVNFVAGTDVALTDGQVANSGLDVLPGGNFVGNTPADFVREINGAGATVASIEDTVVPFVHTSATAAQFGGGLVVLASFGEEAPVAARTTRLPGGSFAAAEVGHITPASFDNGAGGAFGVGEALMDTTRGALVAVFPNNTIGSYGLSLPAELSVFDDH